MLLERRKLGDTRGYLSRLFCSTELAAAGWSKPIAQVNLTMTLRPGTVRGLHFQRPPHAEAKLVTCLHGKVFDVAVDLRAGSPTLLQWHAEELTESNGRSLLIPEGFAHGFQTLTEHCEVLYVHTAPYVPASEGGITAHDNAIGVDWPLPIAELSERDASHPLLDAHFGGLKL
jgi:dTDP-4-dehydrorhamnose 3,5-epimerase